MKRTNLPIFTFIAVFVSILIVGAIIMPYFMETLKKTYLTLQADVNRRQAKYMSQFIKARIDQGVPLDQVAAEIQTGLTGMQFDRGYVCVVDQEDGNYVCHPMAQAVGMSVSGKKALYNREFLNKSWVRFEEELQSGKSGDGLLRYETGTPDEVVAFFSIPEANWTVSSHENTSRIYQEIDRLRNYSIFIALILSLLLAFPISFSVRKVSRRYEDRIIREQEKTDRLLLNILPAPIAKRMKEKESIIVDHFENISVLFCDIVGFTPLSAKTPPEKLVNFLNQIFTAFDKLCAKYGVEKIKTIGDAYMAVSGVPNAKKDHAQVIAKLALDMLKTINNYNIGIKVRIGLHCGEAVAGVIGKQKFSYDLWGDTVNTASRMESNGAPDKIACSNEFYERLKTQFVFKERGMVDIKGKGRVQVWYLEGMKN